MHQTRTVASSLAFAFALAIAVGALYLAFAPSSANTQGDTPTDSDQNTSTPIDPGPGTTYIGPPLWSLLQKHADGQTVPENVVVQFGYRTDVTVATTLEAVIATAGGTKIADYTYRIPIAQLLPIIQRPDVEYAAQEPGVTGASAPYPRMNQTLKDIATAYAGGVSAASAAQYALYIQDDAVVVSLRAPDAATIASIRSWLTERAVHVLPASDLPSLPDNTLAVLLPVEHLAALHSAYNTTYLQASSPAGQGLPLLRTHWPEEARNYEKEIVAQYQPQPSEEGGASGASHTDRRLSCGQTDLTSKRQLHGVDKRHTAGLTGSGVTAGSID